MAHQVIVGSICSPSEFDDNLKIDFSSFVRSKGGISYLPWAEIVRTLHKKVPGCTYGFKENGEGGVIHYTPEGGAYFRPFLTRTYWDLDTGAPIITVETPPGFFPVSDMRSRHKALVRPDIRNIDNCLRRAIAKEIGVMTGIGLQLWAAEDPYDLIDEEESPSETVNGSSGALSRGSAPAPSKASRESLSDTLNRAAASTGLDEHGKATIAVAVKAESWDKIPADKWAPKILSYLANPEYVKLFNAGKNTSGKSINPKSKEQEITEIAAAFRAASPDQE